jgi:hypothetical protein
MAGGLSAVGVPASGAPAPGEPSVPKFLEETGSSGLQSRFDGDSEYMVGGGVATFDCNGDGLPEVYVTGGVNKAKFYRNRSTRGGPIRLEEVRSGLELTNAIGAYPIDIDGDGHADVVVLRVGEVQVFRGLGECRFERTTDRWKVTTTNAWHTAFSATWERGQAWPTLAFGTYVDRARPDFPWGNCTPGLLLRPAATGGGYAPATPLVPGHCALSMLFSDWNRSGDAALRVSNDREYYKGGQEQLWKVLPGETPQLYTKAQGWKSLQIWGMGIASHDLDGDGYPEYVLTSMSDNKMQTLAGDASVPTYKDIAYVRGATAHRPYVGGDIHPSTAWHAQFADMNNDGLADLFIAKGNVATMPDFAALDPNNLLLQRADGQFIEAGQAAGVASVRRGRGAMAVDFNGDGLLDLMVVNRWDKAQLWRNLGSGSASQPQAMGHWLQLRLQQPGGNREAVGAWVEVDLGGRVIRQELTLGGGHVSGHLGWMHFGLGQAERVKVRVQWPHGSWSPWHEVGVDTFVMVDRETGVTPWKQ